ncbi:MAG TPA: hypothetical protein VNX88_22090 [Terriglobales bacterium]|jgi:hypothetical protein|nr:hypothetical protein [Terriglobales bacterium]
MHREIGAIGGIAQIFAELLFVAIRASDSGFNYDHWHACHLPHFCPKLMKEVRLAQVTPGRVVNLDKSNSALNYERNGHVMPIVDSGSIESGGG